MNPEKQENIRNSVETQYQEGFCRDLFCQCLGYTINPEPGYNLITEQKNENDKDNRKADAAIILKGCEDRGMLSPNTVEQIISDWNQLKALDAYQSLYNRFKLQFKYINEGHDNPPPASDVRCEKNQRKTE